MFNNAAPILSKDRLIELFFFEKIDKDDMKIKKKNTKKCFVTIFCEEKLVFHPSKQRFCSGVGFNPPP